MAKPCAPYGMHGIPVSRALRMHGTNQVRYLTQLIIIMSQAYQTLEISEPLGGCICTQTFKAFRSSLPRNNKCNSNQCSCFFLILPDQHTCSQSLVTISFCRGSPMHSNVKQHTATDHSLLNSTSVLHHGAWYYIKSAMSSSSSPPENAPLFPPKMSFSLASV